MIITTIRIHKQRIYIYIAVTPGHGAVFIGGNTVLATLQVWIRESNMTWVTIVGSKINILRGITPYDRINYDWIRITP